LAGLLLSGAPARADSLWDKAMNAIGVGGDHNAAAADQQAPTPAAAQGARDAQTNGKAKAGVAQGKAQPAPATAEAAPADDEDSGRTAFGQPLPKEGLITRMAHGFNESPTTDNGTDGSAGTSGGSPDGMPRQYLLNRWFGWGGRETDESGGAQQAATGHIQQTQPSMWGKAMSAVGLGGGGRARATIDYGPRPKLAVPQNLADLPPPQPRARRVITQPPNEASLTQPPGDYLQKVRGPDGKVAVPKEKKFLGLF
jgi:hypothetical protein